MNIVNIIYEFVDVEHYNEKDANRHKNVHVRQLNIYSVVSSTELHIAQNRPLRKYVKNSDFIAICHD